MSESTQSLVEEYFQSGRLDKLPSQHFINGEWTPAYHGETMATEDPGQARAYHDVAAGTAEDIEQAVAAAKTAQHDWGRLRPSARGAILMRAAELIRGEAARFSVVESLDSGKPLQEAEGDVAGAARTFEYYAGAADKLQGDSFPIGADYLGYSTHEPVGVTGHIIPWNFPISTAARGLAPALAAGCTVVAKPAEQTPLTALMLAELLSRAGLPPGVCNVVCGTGTEAGAPLVNHPDVRHVTFTGSVDTGKAVMQAASRNITRLVLELGGKSPVIVLADADLDAAVEGLLEASYENAGQVCSSGSRLIVERRIHEELVERLVARTTSLVLGHGLRRAQLGPLSSLAHRDKVANYVKGAKERGLSLAAGGSISSDPQTGKGWFHEATIIDDAPDTDPVVQEEIFGPVLTVQVAEDVSHAIELANGTDYALVAGIYTRDFAAAHQLARDVDAGQVFINEYFAGGIEVPFGGNRKSGFGREKGLVALQNYTKLKSVAARIES